MVTLPDARFGQSTKRNNLGVIPNDIPEYEILAAANRLNEQRYYQLTAKQRLFVDAYLGNDFDATKAALEAGFPAEEAERVGRKMLKKTPILLAIQYALEYYTETQKLRLEDLLNELKVMALTSINQIVDMETLDPIIDQEDKKWSAVSKVKRTVTKYGENVEYVMYDRLAAIDKLLKIIAPDALGAADGRRPGDVNNGSTIVNVQTINIIPVPSGQFIEAPASPYHEDAGLVIEHQPFDSVVAKPRPDLASVPLRR